MRHKPKWGYLLVPIFLLFGLWFSVQYLLYVGYRINYTRSMPIGFYKLEYPVTKIQRKRPALPPVQGVICRLAALFETAAVRRFWS